MFQKFLSSSSAGGVTLWGRDLGVVGGNDQRVGGGPCGVPLSGDRQDGELTVDWDLEQSSGWNCHQESGEPDTCYIHR